MAWACSSSSTTEPEPHEFAALVSLAPEHYRDTLTHRFPSGESLSQITARCGLGRDAVRHQIATARGHTRAAIA